MKSKANKLFRAILLATAMTLAISANGAGNHDDHDHDAAEEPRGPHGGRLLESGDFAVEITVFERGIPAEFRVFAYDDGRQLDPQQFAATITTTRLGGARQRFELVAERDYRHGLEPVREPHSFDLVIDARYRDQEVSWRYESHEGRTTIPSRVAEAAGIEVDSAGPAQIVEAIGLTGTVQANPANISEVRARFEGVVRRVLRDVGDVVSRGDALARVESNESLRTFVVDAPINGLIVDRAVQAGQVTADQALFVIADLAQVWVQLDVFGRDLPRVAIGQQAEISTLGGKMAVGTIDWISPLVSHGSQSVRARVVVDNSGGHFRPGQFVRARVLVASSEVPLAVKRSGLQRFRDFDVVFARFGETYEVRMLTLGRQDATYVEVLSGIQPGVEYVAANSYLVKADIEKSGASHDH
jgi:cobalt-zinc-cadmium efflux system membrane fusion protein